MAIGKYIQALVNENIGWVVHCVPPSTNDNEWWCLLAIFDGYKVAIGLHSISLSCTKKSFQLKISIAHGSWTQRFSITLYGDSIAIDTHIKGEISHKLHLWGWRKDHILGLFSSGKFERNE